MIDRLMIELREQWAFSSTFRIGVWCIGLILLLYVALWLDDELTLQQVKWQREIANLEDLKALEDDAFWVKQLERAEATSEARRAQVWNVETSGLAKAIVRDAITATATNTIDEINIREVVFGEPRVVSAGLWAMPGQVIARLDPIRVPWDWISRLESLEPGIAINTIDIRVGTRKSVSIIVEFEAPVTGLETSASD